MDAPEDLQRDTGKKPEVIGRDLADSCLQEDLGLWNHGHLAHNIAEVKRMRDILKPFVFPNS